MRFRLTRSALKDLDLAVEEYARRPATDFVKAHDVVRAFVEQRSQSPRGQEWTNLPVTSAPAHNLHHGRYRGAHLARRGQRRRVAARRRLA